MNQVKNTVIQIVITAVVVWAAAMALSQSGLFITQHQAYNSIVMMK